MIPGSVVLTLGVGLVAWAVAFGATPLAGRLAGLIGMVDRPGGRKLHAAAIPYLGGLGILGGWCVAFLTPGTAIESLVLLGGMIVLMITGFVDDRFEISERLRLVIQIGVGAAAFAGGIRMSPIDNIFGAGAWPLDMALTILWLVGITNAFNFMDNMDGLAAGVGGMGALALGCLGLLFGQQLVSILGFALAGACLGFLRHNFHPARIFMGDTGSLPLGFGLAVLAIKVELPGVHPLIAFSVPIVILGLFIADTVVMTLGRILRREPLMGARLDHISHRMLNRSIPVRNVAFHMYAAAGTLALIGIIISQLPPALGLAAILITVVAWAFPVARIVRWPVMLPSTEGTPKEAPTSAVA